MFTMRFDLRAPESGAPIGDLYAACLEMAAWGEERGCLAAIVSEHHASPDGYLPSPLLLASAIASRTQRLPIQVAALLVPLHDPIELAEQMAVLDILSGGRVSYVCAIGYREEEYALFGREMKGRGRRLEVCVEAMRRARSGEPFEFEGRPVRVTPTPTTPGGPALMMGGGSPAAIRRAARLGMGVMAQGGDPSLDAIYREACEGGGHDARPVPEPRPGDGDLGLRGRGPGPRLARAGPPPAARRAHVRRLDGRRRLRQQVGGGGRRRAARRERGLPDLHPGRGGGVHPARTACCSPSRSAEDCRRSWPGRAWS